MELREVIGRRRSIRYLNPDKPVEKEKIQVMFEAARIASHWGNVQSLRGVALFKESDSDMIDILQGAIIGWQFRIAPVVIIWIVDPEDAVGYQAESLMKLAEVGALGVGSKEVREKGVRETLLPIFAGIGEVLKSVGPCEIDCGQGIAQATLAAYELGLGTCCIGAGPRGNELMQELGVPDTCRMVMAQTVGYPLESWEAGGQRPRRPFEQLFHIHKYGEAYPRSDDVVAELTKDGMFTRPAPLPEREEEILSLRDQLGLKEPGVL
jgi:nitroreductase|tara:strand:- start:319 stop:1116 length:798 start_codon:yes stop_codon:yes gene_type:complete